ncbi:AraC family transcriptional regulator ligand-binding domain-containing protein [Thalassotalea nanhaiensis]|uniref:AraC family transcriptional regulator ligand-binding domain-containing protein n=1 Tax=Thalassotalea nanhaiensis TaxID=3065648 RepID=A0ABY9TEY6_9GAMM|nr:AraC family transcriptional regulator ligand-binding domain-containing protein [Colwelliaceae bacterium SQ345]
MPKFQSQFDHLTTADDEDLIYVSATYLLMMLPLLDEYEIDQIGFFADEGVDVARLGDIGYQVQNKVSCMLWQKLYDLTLDENVGIKAGRFASPKIFNILGPSMGLTQTPLEGMETMFRFFRLFSNAARMYLVRIKAGYRLQINVLTNLEVPKANIDAFFSAFITMCRQHYGDDFSPISMKVPYPEIKDKTYFQRFFRCPVEVSANKLEMVFAKDLLERKVSNITGLASGLLPTVSTKALKDGLKKIDKYHLIDQVKILVKQNLATDEASITNIAARLHMSERTLQRRLASHEYNFRSLTEDCRQELALDYVPNSDLSLTDISHLLGFSNYNNFARAFKRWTGSSPKSYQSSNT